MVRWTVQWRPHWGRGDESLRLVHFVMKTLILFVCLMIHFQLFIISFVFLNLLSFAFILLLLLLLFSLPLGISPPRCEHLLLVHSYISEGKAVLLRVGLALIQLSYPTINDDVITSSDYFECVKRFGKKITDANTLLSVAFGFQIDDECALKEPESDAADEKVVENRTFKLILKDSELYYNEKKEICLTNPSAILTDEQVTSLSHFKIWKNSCSFYFILKTTILDLF